VLAELLPAVRNCNNHRECSTEYRSWEPMLKIVLGGTLLIIYLMTVALSSAHMSERFRIRAGWAVGISLLLLTAASISNYYHHSWDNFTENYTVWDTAHYFLNSKYIDELGYDNLYTCLVAADADGAGRFSGFTQITQMSDYQYFSASEVLTNRQVCDDAFTPQRWTLFRADLQAMLPNTSLSEWRNLMHDHGYNGPPFLSLYGETLYGRFSATALPWLTKIDMVWVAIGIVAIGWAYGLRIALFVTGLLFTMWSTRWPELGHAVSRYDWLGCVLIALAAVRKEQHAIGGIFIGLATLLRVFPVAFAIVYGLKVILSIRKRGIGSWREQLPAEGLHFFSGFALTLLIGISATTVNGGLEQSTAWGEKIGLHTSAEQLNSMRVGLPMALTFRGAIYEPQLAWDTPESGIQEEPGSNRSTVSKNWWVDKQQFFQASKPWVILFTLIALGILGLNHQNLTWDRALALGFIPLFCLTVAHPFFYVMLTIPFIALAGSARQQEKWAACLFLALGPLIFTSQSAGLSVYFSHALFSLVITAYVLWELTRSIKDKWKNPADHM
jgi:hypothetical protein